MPQTPEERARVARENGAKSRGPVTPEGKARSSMNSLKHGLFSEKFSTFEPHYAVACHEFAEDFDLLLATYVDTYRPCGPIAEEIVRDMATARWNIERYQLSLTITWNYHFQGAAKQPGTVDPELTILEVTARATAATLGGHAILARINREIARLQRQLTQLERRLQFVHQHHAPAAVEPEKNSGTNPAAPSECPPINDSAPPLVVTESDPAVIAAYQFQFPGRRILILPPDNVAKGIDEPDDLPNVPRRAA